MQLNLNKATLDLDRLQLLKLCGAKGVQLICRKGMLWVTQEGIVRDDFLAPGCAVRVETDGAVLIEALSASSATLIDEPHSAREPARLRIVASSPGRAGPNQTLRARSAQSAYFTEQP